jgi:Family of unknown function (DUF6941)
MTNPTPPQRPPGIRCHIAALCDAANTSAEGKLNILGEFDRLHSQALPIIWPQMYFVAKLKLGAASVGAHAAELRVVDEDRNLVVQMPGAFVVPPLAHPGLENDFSVILGINNAKFEKEGTYSFELLVDGLPVADAIPLVVVLNRPI